MDTLIARLSDVVFVGYIDGGKSSNTWVDYSCTSCQRGGVGENTNPCFVKIWPTIMMKQNLILFRSGRGGRGIIILTDAISINIECLNFSFRKI